MKHDRVTALLERPACAPSTRAEGEAHGLADQLGPPQPISARQANRSTLFESNQHADIARLATTDSDFAARLDALLAWESVSDAVQQTVDDIIDDIRARGDAALLDYTARFDRWQPDGAAALEIPAERLEQALDAIPRRSARPWSTAAGRIRAYAEHQKMQAGPTARRTAPCWGRRSRRWTGSGSMCPAARRPIRRRC
jgi:hypothetical protein